MTRIIKNPTQTMLEGLAVAATNSYVGSGHAATDSTRAAFLAGMAFALKLAAEIDVPWLPRNMVNDASENIGLWALAERAAHAGNKLARESR